MYKIYKISRRCVMRCILERFYTAINPCVHFCHLFGRDPIFSIFIQDIDEIGQKWPQWPPPSEFIGEYDADFRFRFWLPVCKPLIFINNVGDRYRKYVITWVIRPWVIFEDKIWSFDRSEVLRVNIPIDAIYLAEVNAANNRKVNAWVNVQK